MGGKGPSSCRSLAAVWLVGKGLVSNGIRGGVRMRSAVIALRKPVLPKFKLDWIRVCLSLIFLNHFPMQNSGTVFSMIG